MILDRIVDAPSYFALHPRLARAFAFLASGVESLAEGRHEIEGEEIFATITNSDLKKPADAPLEAHDAYIDIQLVIRGREGFGWRDRASCASPRGEFDISRDIVFFSDPPSTCLSLSEGQFVIFFPGDAHAPLMGEGSVKKCVVKVKL